LDIFHSHPYHFSSRHQQPPSPPHCLLPSSTDAPCTWRLHLSAWALAEPLGAGVSSSYPWHPSSPQRLAGRPASHGASPSSLEIEQELSMMWIGIPAVSRMEHGAGSSYPWLNSSSTPSLLPCKLGFLPGAPPHQCSPLPRPSLPSAQKLPGSSRLHLPLRPLSMASNPLQPSFPWRPSSLSMDEAAHPPLFPHKTAAPPSAPSP
jgi:hypothetical protein